MTKKIKRFFITYVGIVTGTWGLLEAYTYFRAGDLKYELGIYWWLIIYLLPLVLSFIFVWKSTTESEQTQQQPGPIVHNDESVPDFLATYYRCLAEECSHLPLGTIASEYITKKEEDRISLESVYVRLDVQNADRIESDVDDRAWALRLGIGDEKNRIPLLDAISTPGKRFHVILGEAGSGKTTFINYLTFLLARRDQTLSEPIKELLPFHLVLREVAAKHIPSKAEKGTAQMLWNALLDDISNHLGNAPAHRLLDFLQQRMIREGAVVLLDGLDEVPEANSRRKILLEAIRDLVNVLNHSTRSRVLITARPYAYVDPKWRLKNFTSWSLAPFDDGQKLEFVNLWYRVIRSSFGWSEETVKNKGARLIYALKDRPYLGELAGRPLFLTLMAAIHSNRGQLPEDRAELFEEAIRLMLSRWQRARDVRGPDGEKIVEPGLTEALQVDERRIRWPLETLAYNVHKKQRIKPEGQGGPADISKSEVREAFEQLLDVIKLPILLNYLENRAGLLMERKEGVFAFPHRSFQEYLAACHFAEEPSFPNELLDYVNADFEWWKEIFLLAVGKSRRGGLHTAISIVSNLIPESPSEVDVKTDQHWRNAVLGAQAILELGLLERAEGREAYLALIRRIKNWLQKLIVEEHLSSIDRLKAGDSLGYLKDPRKGVGVVNIYNRDLPDIDWVLIPAGSFVMGSADDDKAAYSNERPVHNLSLPNYYVSRYLITNEQFRPFITAGGYKDKKYWNEVGWGWVNGAPPDFTPIDDEALIRRYEKWMSDRPTIKTCPQNWGDTFWAAPTRPVIGVNWYEALAYASWLDELYHDSTIRGLQLFPSALINENFRVRLPSEAEWEKAARGTEGNIWPWGNEYRKGVANTKEEGLGTTSPIGIFPSGSSPFGIMDMVGNVWEWTLTRWGYTTFKAPDYKYPYDPKDGREDETGTHIRAVRGAAWFGGQRDYERCAYRGWGFSFNASSFSGFRLVIAVTEPS